MKIITSIFCLIVISCSSKKSDTNNNYSISATINGLKDSTKVMIYNTETYKPIDSNFVINNQFIFKGNIQEPQPALFFFEGDSLRNYPRYHFWMDKANIKLNINVIETRGGYRNFTKEQLKGSYLNDLLLDYNNSIKYLYEKKGKKALENGILKWVFKKPNNFQALSVVFKYRNDFFNDSLKSYYNLLDNQYKNSTNGKAIKKIIDMDFIKVGDVFRDIKAKDLEGNLIKLSNFKKKVILLDFWSSTCPPCRKQIREEFPKLKNKYKNKDFVIVSFSLDVNYQLWKEASNNDKIDWVNIADLEGYKSKTVLNYNIQAIPATYIIDKFGIIRNLYIGYNENIIEKELDKLLLYN